MHVFKSRLGQPISGNLPLAGFLWPVPIFLNTDRFHGSYIIYRGTEIEGCGI
jgi:hypothetical protein